MQDGNSLISDMIKMLESPLSEEGYELLDIRSFRGGGRLTLRVYIDSENGVTISDCSKAARSIDCLLEESDLLPDSSVVEVSSPGVKKPLRTEKHFSEAVGQKIIIKLATKKNIKGILESFDDQVLIIKSENSEENVNISRDQMLFVNLDPDFDVQAIINRDRQKRKEEKRRVRQERRENKK